MIIAGVLDKQVPPERVRVAYDDLGRHRQGARRPGLFVAQRDVGEEPPADVRASLEWLSKGAVGEQKTGVIRLGY